MRVSQGEKASGGGPQIITTWQVPPLKGQPPIIHFYTISGSASRDLAKTCPHPPIHSLLVCSLFCQCLQFLEDEAPSPNITKVPGDALDRQPVGIYRPRRALARDRPSGLPTHTALSQSLCPPRPAPISHGPTAPFYSPPGALPVAATAWGWELQARTPSRGAA